MIPHASDAGGAPGGSCASSAGTEGGRTFTPGRERAGRTAIEDLPPVSGAWWLIRSGVWCLTGRGRETGEGVARLGGC
jgi:hypothetical protein